MGRRSSGRNNAACATPAVSLWPTPGSNQGNAIDFTKLASGSVEIDRLMAAFNAIALVSMNPWSSRPSRTWI
jgi:hypothetical protein